MLHCRFRTILETRSWLFFGVRGMSSTGMTPVLPMPGGCKQEIGSPRKISG